MVLPERFERSTSPLPRECSTPELRQHFAFARDIQRQSRGGGTMPQALFPTQADLAGGPT